MKLLFAKVAHYPDFDLPKIYYGCCFKKSNRLRELINCTSNETCISLTHMGYWKFHNTKQHKMSSKRYLTCSFLKELKANEQLFSYKCILYLDESKYNSQHSIKLLE